MKIILENPLGVFFKEIGKSSFDTIYIVSPYITMSGAKFIIEHLKRKKTKLLILSNMSSQSIALSLSDPAKPLIYLLDNLKDRVQIRWNPRLHAKMYCIPGKIILYGSSNLTEGGIELNHEINCIIDSKKKENRNLMNQLNEWFDNIWTNSNCIESKEKLERISNDWETTHKKVMAALVNMTPVPSLGGNYWEKLSKLCRKSQWSTKEVAALLNEKTDEQKNTIGKLVFLRDIGVIDFDDKKINIINKLSDKRKAFDAVSKHLVCMKHCLNEIKNNGGSKYDDLRNSINTEESSEINDAVKWLEKLGFIERSKAKDDQKALFTCTKQGSELHV